MPGEADMGSRSVGSPVSEDVVATLVDRVLEMLEVKLRVRGVAGLTAPSEVPQIQEEVERTQVEHPHPLQWSPPIIIEKYRRHTFH